MIKQQSYGECWVFEAAGGSRGSSAAELRCLLTAHTHGFIHDSRTQALLPPPLTRTHLHQASHHTNFVNISISRALSLGAVLAAE